MSLFSLALWPSPTNGAGVCPAEGPPRLPRQGTSFAPPRKNLKNHRRPATSTVHNCTTSGPPAERLVHFTTLQQDLAADHLRDDLQILFFRVSRGGQIWEDATQLFFESMITGARDDSLPPILGRPGHPLGAAVRQCRRRVLRVAPGSLPGLGRSSRKRD